MSPITQLLGWKHPTTGKLHLTNRCLAVRFHRATMEEVTIPGVMTGYDFRPSLDSPLCDFCFPAGRSNDPSA